MGLCLSMAGISSLSQAHFMPMLLEVQLIANGELLCSTDDFGPEASVHLTYRNYIPTSVSSGKGKITFEHHLTRHVQSIEPMSFETVQGARHDDTIRINCIFLPHLVTSV